ncbi:MAG: endonuclease domain-containing protein [Thermoplasmatota archaeon]
MVRTHIERRLCRILDSLGLSGKYLTNQLVAGREVDVFFPDCGIIMEADGEPYHNGENMREDRIRDQTLFALGYRVLRFWGSDLVRAPWRVRRKLVVKLFSGPLELTGLTESERRVVADLMKKRGIRNA